MAGQGGSDEERLEMSGWESGSCLVNCKWWSEFSLDQIIPNKPQK